jgi:hypothetical protein
MNKPASRELPAGKPETGVAGEAPEEPSGRGLSLFWMYIMLAVGLAAAIVLPYYRRIGH